MVASFSAVYAHMAAMVKNHPRKEKKKAKSMIGFRLRSHTGKPTLPKLRITALCSKKDRQHRFRRQGCGTVSSLLKRTKHVSSGFLVSAT